MKQDIAMVDIDLVKFIASVIFDKKGINAIVLDVQDISTMCKYVIIAEGFVDRHVLGIASAIVEATKQKNIFCLASQGMQYGDWVVLDFGQVVVHLLTPYCREKYDLEELYRSAKLLSLTV